MDAAALITGAAIGALSSAVVSFVTAVLFARKMRGQAEDTLATRVAVDRLAYAVAGSDAWFWTPDWQVGEHEADEDLANGRFVRHTSLEDFGKFLDEIPAPAPSPSRVATSR